MHLLQRARGLIESLQGLSGRMRGMSKGFLHVKATTGEGFYIRIFYIEMEEKAAQPASLCSRPSASSE